MKQLTIPDPEISVNGETLYPLATIQLEEQDRPYFHYRPDPEQNGSAITSFQITKDHDGFHVWGYRTSEYIFLEVAHCPPEVSSAIAWLEAGGDQPI
ncbi:MAG: hypothetical protein HC933_10340 [Pleurocapsa sp. SU_196_0]|nr:hypothetical protein [Pleurocapsa sp. SU_196_0]